jgi:hypothetical protein
MKHCRHGGWERDGDWMKVQIGTSGNAMIT